MSKSYNQIDFLGSLKESSKLIEQIKAYYVARGISLNGIRIIAVPEMDQYGSRYYKIRSNIVYDVNDLTMKVALGVRN